jgi:hypothetical protein
MMKRFDILLFTMAAVCVQAQNKKAPTPAQASPAAQEMVCSATEFKVLAYTINEVKLREERVKEWLGKYGKTCPLDQIELIMQNQAVWLGTAQTPPIMASIESIYKQKKAAALELEKAAAAAADKK